MNYGKIQENVKIINKYVIASERLRNALEVLEKYKKGEPVNLSNTKKFRTLNSLGNLKLSEIENEKGNR